MRILIGLSIPRMIVTGDQQGNNENFSPARGLSRGLGKASSMPAGAILSVSFFLLPPYAGV
ncbi:hypothetical protein A2468_02095 [Candidatus Falkowbacteria bacterium RIFOXYC2_FULL_46_15]|nr:MAG: hypothetical protein A2468_02095 [Candidatus Falkowbacteria bacterium RIFOXYC2_FULL_46_15]